MSKVLKLWLDCYGIQRGVGDLWIDRAGNECFFRENGSLSCVTVNNEPTMAIQSEKDSCDIDLIVAKNLKTGMLYNARKDPPRYGDFTGAVDFHSAVLRAQQAQADFMLFPASIRARFSNDPGQLIDFLADSNNRLEAIKLGLIASPVLDSDKVDADKSPSKEGD